MILVVSAKFDKSEGDVLKSLQKSCLDHLIEHDQAIEFHEVPGAIEIPVTIQHFLEQTPGKFSAAIALGCVIKGGSDHYDLVIKSVTDGLTQLALKQGLPIVQGILACHNKEQAIERRKLGKEYAQTALEMKQLFSENI